MNRLPANYIEIVSRLKEQIRHSRLKAALQVNKVLLQLYWEIGATIIQMQKAEGWGTKVIERLSADLRSEFPDFKGLSPRNLKYMSAYAKMFPEFGQQAAAQLEIGAETTSANMQQAAALLPWGHIQVLLDKSIDPRQFEFYAVKSAEHGWSRNILKEQIESDLWNRQGKALTNFSRTLPEPMSDLAQQTLKNPYIFDFIGLSESIQERQLESALIQHLKQFMLELGKGFAFVGRQKNMVVENDDYFLDLLFFNFHLNCFVVIELKVGDFKPEYAGKLNFYVQTVNAQLKQEDHKPTIGILLCKTPNETVVKYSLQDIKSPIGVSNYELAKALPKEIQLEIPTIEEFEAEIEKEVAELKKSVDKKLDHLKDLIGELKQPRVKELKTPETIEHVFSKVAVLFRNRIQFQLTEISKQFTSRNILCYVGGVNHESDQANINYIREQKIIDEIILEVRLNGFIPAGVKAFDVLSRIRFVLNEYKYSLIMSQYNSDNPAFEKLYHEFPNADEIEKITSLFVEDLYENIERHILRIKEEQK